MSSLRSFLQIIFLSMGLLVLGAYSAAVYAESAPVAQVVWINGILKAVAIDKKERTLKRSDMVYEHETLKTDSTSTGQIVFSDSGLMSLREGTEFKIDEYHYKKDGPASGNKFVGDLVKGGFRTVTGAISKDHPENYQVKTPVATIGVSGTEYTIFINQQGALEVSIQKGKIQVKNEKGESELDMNALRYVIVKSRLSPPMTVTTEPAGLSKQVAIEPATPSKELTTAVAPAPTTNPFSKPKNSGGGVGGNSCGTLNIGG